MTMRRQMNMLILAIGLVFPILATVWAAEAWKAPSDAAAVKNPVPKAKESLDRGKLLFLRQCMTCHGISGKGDGPEAAGLDPKPGDFTDVAKMKAQTDGELFWKLTNGRGKMKPYAEISATHTDQEKWDLINFIRTFSEGSKGKSASGDKATTSTAKTEAKTK